MTDQRQTVSMAFSSVCQSISVTEDPDNMLMALNTPAKVRNHPYIRGMIYWVGSLPRSSHLTVRSGRAKRSRTAITIQVKAVLDINKYLVSSNMMKGRAKLNKLCISSRYIFLLKQVQVTHYAHHECGGTSTTKGPGKRDLASCGGLTVAGRWFAATESGPNFEIFSHT